MYLGRFNIIYWDCVHQKQGTIHLLLNTFKRSTGPGIESLKCLKERLRFVVQRNVNTCI